jgi:hypothetical protein
MHTAIALFGIIVYLIGGIWLVGIAFQENPLWVIGNMILPIGLLFAVSHWEEAKRPFFVQLTGLLFLVFGAWLGQFG